MNDSIRKRVFQPAVISEPKTRGVKDPHPKLLFLARSFPPARTPACVRTWSLAKYLSRLGWQVTVVTPHPEVWRETENPEEIARQAEAEGIKRILTDHRFRFLLPNYLNASTLPIARLLGGVARRLASWTDFDRDIGWAKAVEQSCAHLRPDDVDVILATGTPFRAFRIAKTLSRKLDRPYVMDYRDPWTGNPHSIKRLSSSMVKQEASLLRDSAAVTIVSPSWAQALDERFAVGPKLHVLTNGYDPEELENIRSHEFGHFAIVYAGAFYPPKRVIDPVMAALACLKQRGGWYFHYYGEHGNQVRDAAEAFRLTDRTVIHGRVPRREALAAMRGASVAVVITTVLEGCTRDDEGIVTSKLFETIGFGRPTLLVGPVGGDAAKILRATGLGQCFTGSDTKGIVEFLEKALANGIAKGPRRSAEAYSWPNIAARFDAVLRKAAEFRLEGRGSQ